MADSTVQLLGVSIDPLSQEEALLRLHALLLCPGQYHVVTPNSEMLVSAASDPDFRSLLNHAALRLPDGAGLLFLARWTGQLLPERVTGTDTLREFCASLTEEHPVFLLGARAGVAEKAAAALRQHNPRLRVAGTYAGSPRGEDAPDIVARIRASQAHVLFVAYGAPAQERWIAKHLPELPSVRIAMGVGGAFDFLAGVQVRAPSLLRRLGLEWLWRVLREPQRIGRIWRAVVVFPFLVLRHGTAAPGTRQRK